LSEIPTKPYLLRALFEWCVDNGYTPHLAVKVDSRAQVPPEYVKNGEITLNISPTAVHKLQMGNEEIQFSAPSPGGRRRPNPSRACRWSSPRRSCPCRAARRSRRRSPPAAASPRCAGSSSA